MSFWTKFMADRILSRYRESSRLQKCSQSTHTKAAARSQATLPFCKKSPVRAFNRRMYKTIIIELDRHALLAKPPQNPLSTRKPPKPIKSNHPRDQQLDPSDPNPAFLSTPPTPPLFAPRTPSNPPSTSPAQISTQYN